MSGSLSVFLLPHQDDEFGVFALLEQNVRLGQRSVCIFLTDGAGNGVSPALRDRESSKVLRKIGIPDEDIRFIPPRHRAQDGHLVEQMDKILDSLVELLRNESVGTIYSPTWEGGHPDHDAAALIAQALAAKVKAKKLRYFPLYSAYQATLMPFCVMRMIPRNSETHRFPVKLRCTLRYVGYCMQYKSQWKTWCGLLPFVFWHLIRRRYQSVQALDHYFFSARPHVEPMLYERRHWTTWTRFQQQALPFIASNFKEAEGRVAPNDLE